MEEVCICMVEGKQSSECASRSGMLAGRSHHCMELQERYAATDFDNNKIATGAWAERIVSKYVQT
jgi:hypothetical protein